MVSPSSTPFVCQKFNFIGSHKLMTTYPQMQVLNIDQLNEADSPPIPDPRLIYTSSGCSA